MIDKEMIKQAESELAIMASIGTELKSVARAITGVGSSISAACTAIASKLAGQALADSARACTRLVDGALERAGAKPAGDDSHNWESDASKKAYANRRNYAVRTLTQALCKAWNIPAPAKKDPAWNAETRLASLIAQAAERGQLDVLRLAIAAAVEAGKLAGENA